MPTRTGKALIFCAALAALALGACQETKFVAQTVKSLQKEPAPPGYKVGDPYQINGTWYYPAEDYGYIETGIASFYGGENRGTNFHGRSTANGELYDMNALTAAHQTLPMPSLVRVTNLENGRSLVLRVNDRGPFARGRIIDVSRRSAQLLGFEGQGTARVRVEILADESRNLKMALLQGAPGAASTSVAAVPRDTVASDALPPPAGARDAGQTTVASNALPLPSVTVTLPPTQTAPARVDNRGRPRPPQQQPMARPAPPVVATPSTNVASAAPGPVPAPRPATPSREVAALPVPQQAGAQPVVTQQQVRPSTLFVQAGAFANYDTAYRLGARLSRYGKVQVTPATAGAQQVFRVRVGPVFSVNEADDLLEQVASVVPEARVVVVD
jgi:rare lipoprotein A